MSRTGIDELETTPEEQRQALKEGRYGEDMDQEKKEMLELRLDFQTYTDRAFNTAQQVMTIADNLDIDIPEDLKQGLHVAQTATGVASKVLSAAATSGFAAFSGYMGAAVMATSLLKKKKGGINQQIMKSLGVINKKLDYVIKLQRRMLENQATMIKNQQTILMSLAS